MAEMKTRKTGASVEAFLGALEAPRREDCRALVRLMREATGAPPKMWGPSIVGFGAHHYKYESGREGEWFLAGFSPRKAALTLYLTSGLRHDAALLRKLGKHKTGGGCLYIKKLADVDLEVLAQLIQGAVRQKQQPRA